MEIDNYTDQEIVQAILDRDTFVTKEYLYKKCYPMFKAIHSRYYTDCETTIDFISEIYVYILSVHPQTGTCKLAGFRFMSSLYSWLKVVSLNYCHCLYAKRMDVNNNHNIDDDRELIEDLSVDLDVSRLDKRDVQALLMQMPNIRYRKLIELRYVQEKTNEETATALDMTMQNYYNKHKLAKAQFYAVLRKEGLL
ncbi:RNA polymerase sigma factor [Phocaeicola barnesiae]